MTPSLADSALLVAVLAAGRGSRFGGGKLDAPCAGQPLGRWALDAVLEAGLPPGLIVTGLDIPQFAREAKDWTILPNTQSETGLASSLACAARHAQAKRAPALLVLLADMPLVPGRFLRDMAASRAPAATTYPGGRPGVPALLPAYLFEGVASLKGDRGATSLLATDPATQWLAAEPDWLLDVDTPDELIRVDRVLRARA